MPRISTRAAVWPALLAIFAGVAVGSLQPKQAGEQELRAFAEKIESSMNARDTSVFEQAVNRDALFAAISHGVPARPEYGQGFRVGLDAQAPMTRYAKAILTMLGKHGEFKLLRIRHEG